MRKRADCFPGSIGKNLPLRRRAAEKNRDRILPIPAPCGVSQPLLTLLPSVKTPSPPGTPPALCRRNVWVDYPRTGPVAILKTHHHVARSAGFAHPPTTSPDGATAQPIQGCLYMGHSPRVAPRRRNPGLCGRIPLGFPEGDFSTFPLSAFICTKCGCLSPCQDAPNRPSAFRDGPFQSSDCGATGGLAKRTR